MSPKFIQFNIENSGRTLIPISSISRIDENFRGDCIVHLITGITLVTTDGYCSMVRELDRLGFITDSHERADLEE
jgi:hypothetical protein